MFKYRYFISPLGNLYRNYHNGNLQDSMYWFQYNEYTGNFTMIHRANMTLTIDKFVEITTEDAEEFMFLEKL